jgi:hypothetical protein
VVHGIAPILFPQKFPHVLFHDFWDWHRAVNEARAFEAAVFRQRFCRGTDGALKCATTNATPQGAAY